MKIEEIAVVRENLPAASYWEHRRTANIVAGSVHRGSPVDASVKIKGRSGMFCKLHTNSESHKSWMTGASVKLAATIAVVGVFLGSPARSESVDLMISNADNRTAKVTATDLNDGSKTIVSGQTLTHNGQLTTKMLLDKDNNGHVKFEATAVDTKDDCEKRTYEGRQLSRGFNWQVSFKCK